MQEEEETSPYAPPAMPPVPPAMPLAGPGAGTTQDDRTMGMLVHLLGLLTGIIGVLILWLVKKDQSRFVDHHGKEALNFQLTLLIYMLGMLALAFVAGVLTMGIGMIVIFPLIFAVSIGALVLEILACLAANRGEWHRYPMTIRLIG